jgi:hypothetical protein
MRLIRNMCAFIWRTEVLFIAFSLVHSAYESKWKHDDENQVRSFARILATTTANTAAAHMKMNLQHYYKTLHGPKPTR